MQISFIFEDEDIHLLEVDEHSKLKDVKEILCAFIGDQTPSIGLYHDGKQLIGDDKNIGDFSLIEGDVIFVRVEHFKAHIPSISTASPQITPPRAETQLEKLHPEIVTAAREDPAKFAALMVKFRNEIFINQESPLQKLRHDPTNMEAQKRIDDIVREQNIMENLANAMEFHPESFGSVTMLYTAGPKLPSVLLDFKKKSHILVSEICAKDCGIDKLIDTRFSGIAKGVGTGKIVGKVHMAQLQLGNQFLPCSFTVLEGTIGENMLLGLDMLKRHQIIIDLQRNCLIVDDENIPFLDEADLDSKDSVS